MFSALPPSLPALARRFSPGPITPLTARLRWWPGFGQHVVVRWQLLPGEAVAPRLGTSPTLVAVTKFFGLRLDRLSAAFARECMFHPWWSGLGLGIFAQFRFGEVLRVLDVGDHSGCCAVASGNPKPSISAGVNALLCPDVVR